MDQLPREGILFAVLLLVQMLLELITVRKHQIRVFANQFATDDHIEELERHTVGEGTSFPGWMRSFQQQLLCLQILQDSLQPALTRRILCPWYIKPRTIEWFYLNIDWSPERDPQRFKEFFRITPDMFFEVCDIVRPDMQSAAPACFHSLPNRDLLVERQVAVAIRRLATGDQILGIGELFGVSKTTASRVTWKFVCAFSRRGRRFLTWPQGRDMASVKDGFSQRWRFPNCCGAIDVTHFLIELPAGENAQSYYDWRRNKSVSMQAIVDVRCHFLDVFIGISGSVADSRVLRRSAFFHNVVYQRTKLNGPSIAMPQNYMLGEYLLGDKGYPLYKWLVTPYPRNVSVAKDRWNKQHSGARMCVERAFGKLKGIWRILSRTILRPKLERLAHTVHACVLLHNMMIERGDESHIALFGDVPAHPDGNNRNPRHNNSIFRGGREARESLFHSLEPSLLGGP